MESTRSKCFHQVRVILNDFQLLRSVTQEIFETQNKNRRNRQEIQSMKDRICQQITKCSGANDIRIPSENSEEFQNFQLWIYFEDLSFQIQNVKCPSHIALDSGVAEAGGNTETGRLRHGTGASNHAAGPAAVASTTVAGCGRLARAAARAMDPIPAGRPPRRPGRRREN
jgi:hypothetical protein